MITISLFDGPTSLPGKLADLSTYLEDRTTNFWVDINAVDGIAIDVLEDTFGFHPLTIEDTHNERQRPKLVEFGAYIFIISNPLRIDDDNHPIWELDIYAGRNYIVTVHDNSPGATRIVRTAMDACTTRARDNHIDTDDMLYVLMKAIVSDYGPAIQEIEEELERLEAGINTHATRQHLHDLFEMRRDTSEIARILKTQRGIFEELLGTEFSFMQQEEIRYYLRDLLHDVIRIEDSLAIIHEAVSSLIDLYMTAVSNQLNHVVNRLTIITIVFGLLGLFSGFYGMNFSTFWPPTDAPWSVPVVLVMMIAAVVVFVAELRRRDWF